MTHCTDLTPTDPVWLWQQILQEVQQQAQQEPVLTSFLYSTVLNHSSLAAALSFHLANILNCNTLPALLVREVADEALIKDPSIIISVANDIRATKERDAVCKTYSTPLLFFKGFHALQGYRVAHWLWQQGRESLALFFQNRISTVLGVDIHPAAQIGSGILMDHATGIVVGETAVIEDRVSILHGVTLGGTGKETGDRHPKIRQGVLLSAHATVLGNVEIGKCAKVAAGSVVLENVPPHTTVAGVPAKITGQRPQEDDPAQSMDQQI